MDTANSGVANPIPKIRSVMPSKRSLPRFSVLLWLTLGMFVVFSATFILYVRAEKQIDHANELRQQSFILAEELRQSSDDLTRMVRTYIVTGDAIYKQHFQEILDIRDGKKPRPVDYQNIYWDLVLTDNRRPTPPGAAVPLMELMRQAGFAEPELAKLAEAKAKSDVLARAELAAMAMVESTHPTAEADRAKAIRMMHDAAYHQAKAEIMEPIHDFYRMMDQRTLQAVHVAEARAIQMRIAFIMLGLLLLAMLWNTRRSLNAILGGPVIEIYEAIARIGSGDFSTVVSVRNGRGDSILGWLAKTQASLIQIDVQRNDAEARNHRLTQLYAALSQCNQALVRCTSEVELYPQICRDVVTIGGMKMAWIGMLDEQSKQIRPVASFGSGTEYLEKLQISVEADKPSGRGPTGTACREDQPIWIQDFLHDPATAAWHETGAKFGWAASAALPLHRNGKVVGALCLYAQVNNAFDKGVRDLLLEIATDVDYALRNFEHDAQRKQAETDLRIAAAAFESQEGMMVTDARGVILRVNRAFTEITGYTAEEAKGQTPRLIKSGRHNEDFYRDMWETVDRTGSWQGEVWDRRKNGEEYPKWLTVSAVRDADGVVTHYIGTHYDITERKKAEEKIKQLAFFDQLTGLPNRTLLIDRLKQAMTASSRNGSYGAVLLIDLDNFKTLNDTLSHDTGDLLLREVAQRLTNCVRAEDTVARLGGDEFVVMLVGLSAIEVDAAAQAETVAHKILFAFDEQYQLNDVAYHVTPSIGATMFRGHLSAMDDLLKQADLAMYKAKAAGRNTLRFFDPDMEAAVMDRATLETDLRQAIQEKQFLLYYQAQVVDEGRITGAEVLVRWQHPHRGTVSPAQFIPLAEETGLIQHLGQWVLETACTQIAAWGERPEMAGFTIAVNVSAHQFRQTDFVEQVLTVLENTGANPTRLKLELTESLLVHDVEEIIEKMFALKAKGVGFSMDDFGTGYSSLSYLKRLPLDQLKIDQSFVRDVLSDPNDASIAKTIIALAQNLSLGVIAEGVETAAQRDFLANAGCHAYQGYFFSRPLPLEDFEEFARQI